MGMGPNSCIHKSTFTIRVRPQSPFWSLVVGGEAVTHRPSLAEIRSGGPWQSALASSTTCSAPPRLASSISPFHKEPTSPLSSYSQPPATRPNNSANEPNIAYRISQPAHPALSSPTFPFTKTPPSSWDKQLFMSIENLKTFGEFPAPHPPHSHPPAPPRQPCYPVLVLQEVHRLCAMSSRTSVIGAGPVSLCPGNEPSY